MADILFVDAASSYLFMATFQQKPGGLKCINAVIESPPLKQVNWFDQAWQQATGLLPPRIVALGRGPGSFTALRISFSYVRTRYLVENFDLRSFDSLAFWRDLLCPRAELFLMRSNRNLYYGIDQNNNILAKSTKEWHIYIKEKEISQVHTWLNQVNAPHSFENIIEEPALPEFSVIQDLCQQHLGEIKTTLVEFLPNYVHNLTYQKKIN